MVPGCGDCSLKGGISGHGGRAHRIEASAARIRRHGRNELVELAVDHRAVRPKDLRQVRAAVAAEPSFDRHTVVRSDDIDGRIIARLREPEVLLGEPWSKIELAMRRRTAGRRVVDRERARARLKIIAVALDSAATRRG